MPLLILFSLYITTTANNQASYNSVTQFSAQSIYNATKHAVVGWTRSLAMLKDICNVRVNAGMKKTAELLLLSHE